MKTTLLILAAVCGIAGILLMLSEPSEACTTYEWVQVFLGTRALGAVLIMASYRAASHLHLFDNIEE